MPYPDDCDTSLTVNRLIYDELGYDNLSLVEEHKKLLQMMTDEKRSVYKTIMHSVYSAKGGTYFVYGCGGTAKTFMWNTLSTALRSKNEIVLNVASSGIASLLLPGGRTAHSRFLIPLNINEDSTCNIFQGSDLAELMVKAKLIIWDEAPMMHRHYFEALDRTLRDIMRIENHLSCNQPFGRKTIVFGGDFRQILPVIPKGSRQDIVLATINLSYLWAYCKVLRLTKNMRLQNLGNDDCGIELKEFSEWILSIRDGTFGSDNDGHPRIEVPNDLLVDVFDNPVKSIVKSTYPSFTRNNDDVSCLHERAILAPTLDLVQNINDYMVLINLAEGRSYFSSDSLCRAENSNGFFEDIHSMEFLNSIKCSGVHAHKLMLKVSVFMMLLRNIDHSVGLCNGTRLIITKLGLHVVEATIICGINVGEKVFIPRLSLPLSDVRLSFKFQRRQFSLTVSYAMTINKSQGQSLSHVGLFLKKSIFSHGQLYVALSRVTNRASLKILIYDEEEKLMNVTTNVVYKEVFQNL